MSHMLDDKCYTFWERFSHDIRVLICHGGQKSGGLTCTCSSSELCQTPSSESWLAAWFTSDRLNQEMQGGRIVQVKYWLGMKLSFFCH